MRIVNFAEQNTVVNRYMQELRDNNLQSDRARFRRNLERIGEVMAYEISKTLDYTVKEVTTPLGVASVSTADNDIVLGTIFRAGLPFHQGFLNVFDRADNAFVSAYRYYKDKECREVGIHIEYMAAPDLTGKTLILADPMLATGGSMELGYHAFETHGRPAHVHLCCVIASQAGVDYIREHFKDTDVTLWCAAIDPALNEHMYIVPGLGDAGDLAYGGKL
ncbi:MAG: uracil phosphoribosyltransferase [Paraprevotella sp.]|nr:uracil phosphoribosyltransferase [Paraprevotella sp.]MBP3471242.1 uracil phosphoribosyltransferase [Paraprevotella sp.]